MITERAVVYGVIGLVLATTLVSGPLISGVDFTKSPEKPTFGSGNATIDGVAFPASAEISEGRYGSGEFVLRVPDASIEVTEVVEGPALAYRVTIPSMGYSRTTTHFITSDNTGHYALSMADDSLEPSMVEKRSYDGMLSVFLRSNQTDRRLGQRNITVEVTR